MIDKAQAILSLEPESKFVIRDGVIEWLSSDIDQPSDNEIDTEVKRLEVEYDSQEYARQRALAYPSVGDQLDMLMKDMKNGTKTHQEACEAVKTKFPKS